MTRSAFAALGALILLAGCSGTPAPSPDRDAPRTRLSLLNAIGNPNFDSNEGPVAPVDACTKIRDFPTEPARMAVSLRDEGGLAMVDVRVFAGEIIDSSVVGADSWTMRNFTSGAYDHLEVRFPGPTDGRVLKSALLVFDVTTPTAPTAIVIETRDQTGNLGTLYQVDLRAANDPTRCRGEPRT